MTIILTPQQVLDRLPQQHPFRFVDEILEINDASITGSYTFRNDEFFYPGHFPGNPVTPGVILVESMAQVSVVALGIYLLTKEIGDEAGNYVALFSDGQFEFAQPVLPGEKVTIKGEKIFWRQKKLRSKVEMINSQGQIVASGTLSGIGVKK